MSYTEYRVCYYTHADTVRQWDDRDVFDTFDAAVSHAETLHAQHGYNWVVYSITTTLDAHGDVIALFPDNLDRLPGCVTAYQHVGQHSIAAYDNVIRATKPSTSVEYAELYDELVRIGYDDLKIAKRR